MLFFTERQALSYISVEKESKNHSVFIHCLLALLNTPSVSLRKKILWVFTTTVPEVL